MSDLAVIETDQRELVASIRAAIAATASTAEVMDLKERIEAARVWAKAYQQINEHRADLLRLEVDALVRLVELDGLHLLSTVEANTARWLAGAGVEGRAEILSRYGAAASAQGMRWMESRDSGRKVRQSVAREAGRQWVQDRSEAQAAIVSELDTFFDLGLPFEVADLASRVAMNLGAPSDDFMEGVREMCRTALRKSPSTTVAGTVIPRFVTSRVDANQWVRVPTMHATYGDLLESLAMREEQLRQDQEALGRFREFVREVAAHTQDRDAVVGDVLPVRDEVAA